MKRIKQLVVAITFMAGIGLMALPAHDVLAIDVIGGQCALSTNVDSPICKGVKDDNTTTMTTQIINTMLYVLGILAVIMIIFGGIRYVTSTGDASRVKGAKDTITYAVVGLIVAVLAYAIVNFVITRF